MQQHRVTWRPAVRLNYRYGIQILRMRVSPRVTPPVSESYRSFLIYCCYCILCVIQAEAAEKVENQ